MQHQLHALLASYTPPRAYQRHFTVKSRSAVLLLKAEEVDFVSAEGNYVALHRSMEEFLIREPLSQLEQRLDPAIFARIHRSTLVNVNGVHSFLPASHGDYVVVLKSGVRLDLSRHYREKLNASLGLEL